MLIANIFLLRATKKAADAAVNQGTLMRQQLVGTQAAVVVVAEYPGIESPTAQNYGFNISFRNEGHIAASNVEIGINLYTETVEDGNRAEKSWKCDFVLPQLAPAKTEGRQCFLKELDQLTWRPVGAFQKTIVAEGSYSYWNGFEKISGLPICMRYIPNGLKSTFGIGGSREFCLVR